MESAFRFARLFGIEFRVHFSWFLIFALLTVFLANDVFPGAVRGLSTPTYWIMGASTSFLFFFSVLLHETGHSLVARANGIPVSAITLFLFGGAAQMTREPASAGAELKMATAGPATSLILAGGFWLICRLFLGAVNPVAAISLWLSQINLIVAVFNLLPGFPLDGGRVLRGIWWRISGDYARATRVAVFCGRLAGLIIIGVGVYIVLEYRDWLAGAWLAVIGWYLENSARTSLKQFELQQWMKGRKVAEVMEKDCVEVSGEVTLEEIKQKFPTAVCVSIMAEDHIDAVAFLPTLIDKPGVTQIVELAQSVRHAINIAPGDDLLTLAQEMNETGKDFAAVREDGAIVGYVFLDALIDLVNRSRTEIGT